MKPEISVELQRCLQCLNKPCQNQCPLHNDIPQIIELLKQSQQKLAAEILLKQSPFGSICGRICPKSSQCQKRCTRQYKDFPIQTGLIESFLGDLILKNNWRLHASLNNNKEVAIIGGGPAGLTCAYFLKLAGYNITIFERKGHLGGLLLYGIPDFRLSKNIVNQNIDYIIKDMKVKYNQTLNKDFALKDLLATYDAIVISTGTYLPIKMNIPGEELKGVFNGNILLENDSKLDYSNKNVAIIGGGNVALDTARAVNKAGAKKVTIIYRRCEKMMPAETSEIKAAQTEGIDFLFETNVTEIVGKNNVQSINCIKTKITENNDIENIPNTGFTISTDYVIECLGTINGLIVPEIKTNEDNKIIINENNQTNIPNVFACGDLIEHKKTVAYAAASGHKTAENIIKYFANK